MAKDYRVDRAWLTDANGEPLTEKDLTNASGEYLGDTVTIGTSGTGAKILYFYMPDCDVVVHVTTKGTNCYGVTLDNADSNGTIALSGISDADNVQANSAVTLTVTPESGYRVSAVTITLASGEAFAATAGADNTYTFTMPACNVTVTATFTRLYTVRLDDTENQTSTYLSLPDGDKYAEGDNVTVQVNPATLGNGKVLNQINVRHVVDNRYEYITPSVNTDGSITFAMPANNVEVVADVIKGYYITLKTEGGNENCTAEITKAETAYDGRLYKQTNGEAFCVNATADTGYRVKSIVVKDASGTEKELMGDFLGNVYIPTSDVTVTVTFARLHGVTVNATANGTVVADKTANLVAHDTVTLTVTPENGYKLDTLTVTDAQSNTYETSAGEENKYTFAMPDADVTVAATFVQKKYPVEIKNGFASYLSIVGGQTEFAENERVTIQVTEPDDLCKVITYFHVSVAIDENASTRDVEYTCDPDDYTRVSFTMPAGKVNVYFDMDDGYHLTLNTEGGDTGYGATLPECAKDWQGRFYAAQGDEVKLKVTYESFRYSYTVKDADGSPLAVEKRSSTTIDSSTVDTLSFTMPAGDLTVNVKFDKLYWVMLDNTGYFSLEGGRGQYNAGEIVTVNVDESRVPNGKVMTSVMAIYDDNLDEPTQVPIQINGNRFTFTMPAHGVMLGYTLADGYYLTLNPVGAGEGCSVTYNSGTSSGYDGRRYFEAGDTVVLKVECPSDYDCTVKAEAANGADVTCTGSTDVSIIMPESNVTVTVTFTRMYTVTLSAPGTVLSLADNKSRYAAGDTVNIGVTEPGAGYVISELTVRTDAGTTLEQSASDTGISFFMPDSDVTVSAKTAEGYYIHFTVTGANDSCSAQLTTNANPAYGNKWYAQAGASVTVKITCGTGYQCKYVFNDVQSNAGGTDNSTVERSFTMAQKDATVTIAFSPRVFKLRMRIAVDGNTQNVTAKVSGTENELSTTSAFINVTLQAGTYTVTFDDVPGYQKIPDTTFNVSNEGEVTGDKISTETINRNTVYQINIELTPIPPSYVITIPSSVSLNTAESMTITTSDVQNLNGQSINVSVSSANGGKLKNGETAIGYSFAVSLNFKEAGSQNLALTIAEGEKGGKPAGTYTDTLHFSIALSGAAADSE